MTNYDDVIYLLGLLFVFAIGLVFFRLAIAAVIRSVDYIFDKFIQLLLSPFKRNKHKRSQGQKRDYSNDLDSTSSDFECRKLKIKKYMDIQL